MDDTLHWAILQAIKLDIARARVTGQVAERPYGLLFFNAANPEYHTANMARWIRAHEPETVAEAIIAFYQGHRLTPRIKVDALTQPADLATRLEAYGFTIHTSTARVMVWESVPVPTRVAPALSVRRAGPADLDVLVRVAAEGFGEEDSTWMRRKLHQQLAHATMRHYLASFDGEPASCASVLDGAGIGLVDDVTTVPAFRGRGLATAVLTQIQAEAAMPLLLEVDTADAARIYARAGFVDRGELRETMCWLPV